MRWLRLMLWSSLVLVIAACNLAVPNATPTVAPTNTPPPETEIAIEPSRTPIIRFTNTPTITPLATITPIPTDTPTPTPTGTQSPTATFTVTPSPTNTPTSTPSNTPTATFTPSDTPTGTRTPTATPSDTPTFTVTPSPTDTSTSTPTDTPTNTTTPSPTQPPTLTPIPIIETDTPLPTLTPTATNTPLPTITPSLTPTLTPSLTFTPLPPPASSTPVPSATNTSEPQFTDTPTQTATPDLTATLNAQILQTRAAPTFTPIPLATATNTLIPPTIDAPPTFITATPNTGIIPTPVTPPTVTFSTPVIATDAPPPTATPIIFPTPFPQEQIPPTVISVETRPDAQQSVPTFNTSNTEAYTYNVGDGGFTFNGLAINGSVGLFAANPAGGGSYARTDANGYLTFVPFGGSGEQGLSTSPFFAGFSVSSPEENKNYVTDLAWSPNGQQFSFLIDPIQRGGQDYQNAGVWYWDARTGGAYPLLHDCPADFYSSCQSNLSKPVNHWRSVNVEWSPDSTRALITVTLPDEGRQAIFIANAIPDENVAQNPPPMYRFDNGQWLDNQRILVSGRTEAANNTFIGVYNVRDNVMESVLFDGNANGISIADAVQRPNGTVIALGRPGGLNGALQMYQIANGVATPISGFVGDRYPTRIEWAGNYTEAVLYFGTQQVSINTANGAIANVNTAGAVQVNTNAPPGGQASSQPRVELPTGVVAGNRYDAGQQIQYIGDIPRNMRQQPSIAAGLVDVINPGEFVTVLAGPVVADGYEWWFVSNARNTQSWISTHSTDGGAFFNP